MVADAMGLEVEQLRWYQDRRQYAIGTVAGYCFSHRRTLYEFMIRGSYRGAKVRAANPS